MSINLIKPVPRMLGSADSARTDIDNVWLQNLDDKLRARRKRRAAALIRKAVKKQKEQLEQELVERDYRKWQHDQRMMWVRENDGTNQCIPANGWAILLNRIANHSYELRMTLTAPRLRFTL